MNYSKGLYYEKIKDSNKTFNYLDVPKTLNKFIFKSKIINKVKF